MHKVEVEVCSIPNSANSTRSTNIMHEAGGSRRHDHAVACGWKRTTRPSTATARARLQVTTQTAPTPGRRQELVQQSVQLQGYITTLCQARDNAPPPSTARVGHRTHTDRNNVAFFNHRETHALDGCSMHAMCVCVCVRLSEGGEKQWSKDVNR